MAPLSLIARKQDFMQLLADATGNTVLHLVAGAGLDTLVRLLVEHGADATMGRAGALQTSRRIELEPFDRAELETLANTSKGSNVLAAIRKDRATSLPGVPTMFQALLDAPNFGHHDFSSLKMLMYAAAPMPDISTTRSPASGPITASSR